MKSQKAKEYLDMHASRTVDVHITEAIQAVEIAEEEVLTRAYHELTKWNDPKEELPNEDSRVLCKVYGCEITEYLVLNYYKGRWWACHPHLDDECSEDSWELFDGTVIGWREIQE